MTKLIDLPPELLRIIVEDLNLFDLEVVAQTLNRVLYQTTQALLAPRIPWLQHVKRMRKAFVSDRPLFNSPLVPEVSSVSNQPTCDSAGASDVSSEDSWSENGQILLRFPGHFPEIQCGIGCQLVHLPMSLAAKLGLSDNWEICYTRCSPPDLRSCMKLDGSLEWLERLPPALEEAMAPHHGSYGNALVTSEQLEDLERQAARLGLTLPPGFNAFVQSDVLQYRMPSSMAWFFHLGSRFMKCPKSLDKGNEGYLIQLHCDQQYCAYSLLYLDTHGGSCVLRSTVGFEEDIKSERYLEVERLALDARLLTEAEISASHAEGAVPLAIPFDEEEDEIFWDIELLSLSFEEYLATTYFEEMLWFLAHDHEFDPPQGLKDYARHIYVPMPMDDHQPLQNGSSAHVGSFDMNVSFGSGAASDARGSSGIAGLTPGSPDTNSSSVTGGASGTDETVRNGSLCSQLTVHGVLWKRSGLL